MQPTIVIVDDDPQFRHLAGALLDAGGYRIVGEAASICEGLALVTTLRPQAVLLDVHLPDGDGVNAAARLAQAGGSRVVLTSSDATAASDRLARRYGAVGFVTKADLTAAVLRGRLSRSPSRAPG